jgi:BASS family bile acid:Na+ symporter
MDILDVFYTTFTPIALFILMVGLGLSLTIPDLKRVFLFPKAATIGIVGQFLLLPLLAFALVEIFSPPALIAVGLILIAASPSGVTSNTYTFAARGDVALSVTLTAISSLITVFSLPLLAWLALNRYLDESIRPDVNALAMMESLVKMTLIPIVTGMLIRHFQEQFVLRWLETVRKVALVVLVVLIVGSVIVSLNSVAEYFMDAALVAFLLNAIAMTTAFLAARYFKLNDAQVICITYEIGVQNLALALTIALAVLKEPVIGLACLIYGIFAKLASLGFMFYARNLTKESVEGSIPGAESQFAKG